MRNPNSRLDLVLQKQVAKYSVKSKQSSVFEFMESKELIKRLDNYVV